MRIVPDIEIRDLIGSGKSEDEVVEIIMETTGVVYVDAQQILASRPGRRSPI